MTDSKKKFRVVGIPYAKSVTTYAKKLEETMNQLSEDGYSFQITEQKSGTVVIGQLAEAMKHPLQQLLEAREARAREQEKFSPRTRELLGRVAQLPGDGTDIEALEIEVKKNLVSLTRGYGAEELSVAAKELEAAAATHVNHPGHDADCTYDKALLVVAANVRNAIQAQLQ